MSEHEFTTAEVREAFVEYQQEFIDVDAWGFAGDWFDRWLAGELQKAYQCGREDAARSAEAAASSKSLRHDVVKWIGTCARVGATEAVFGKPSAARGEGNHE